MTTEHNIYYVYLHRRADDNEVFYVGKGKDNRANIVCKRNKYWQNVVAKHGGFVVEYVEKELSESDAFDLEIETIKFYRECGHTLTNLTDGGEGISGWVPSEESRQRYSKAKKGKKKSAATRQSMSDNRPKRPVACSNGMRFPSTTAAAKWVSEVTQGKRTSGSIVNCCKGLKGTAYSLRWRYVDENGEIDESYHDHPIDTIIPHRRRKFAPAVSSLEPDCIP